MERSDDFDDDFFEIMFCVFCLEFGESAFGEELAVVDDADGVAEPLHFAHDMGGKDDGLALGTAVGDESDNGASGHDVKAGGGLVENPDRRIVNEGELD